MILKVETSGTADTYPGDFTRCEPIDNSERVTLCCAGQCRLCGQSAVSSIA